MCREDRGHRRQLTKASPHQPCISLRLVTLWAAFLSLSLGACSTVPDWADPVPPSPASLTQELLAKTKLAPPHRAVAKNDVASGSPPSRAASGESRILFREGSAQLSDTAKRQLEDLARLLMQATSVRVQLLAYAKRTDDSARRKSLTRALMVRAFLIAQGVRSTR